MNNLTIGRWRTTLELPSCILAVGIRTPFSPGQKKAALCFAVFLCPSKIINTGLFSVKSLMVGCIGHLSRWQFLDCSSNLVQPATQLFELMCGGFKSNPGETAMFSKNQKPTFSVSRKPIDSSSNRTPLNQYAGVVI